MWLSLRFQGTSGWGRKFSPLWLEGHMANEILIPFSLLFRASLSPCSQTVEQQWVQLRDSGKATPQYVLKAPLSSAEP